MHEWRLYALTTANGTKSIDTDMILLDFVVPFVSMFLSSGMFEKSRSCTLCLVFCMKGLGEEDVVFINTE